jgi:hypothetical protein
MILSNPSTMQMAMEAHSRAFGIGRRIPIIKKYMG